MSYRAIQEESYEANRLLPEFGLVDLTFGNVSVMDRNQGVFAIKPSGVDYQSLRSRDMVVLDLKGKVVQGKMRPSSDTPTHLRLFQAFPLIRSVVHTHSRNATAFAQAGLSIPCFGTTHADYFYGAVPVTRPMTPKEIVNEYELETGNLIVDLFKNFDPQQVPGVLVYGHGPFVWGPSGKKSVETALALEIIAEMALKTLQLNPKSKPLALPQLKKHFFRKHGTTAYYGQG